MATATRAARVVEIHGRAINESRRRAGLTQLTTAELTREFDVVNRSPGRKAVATRTTSNTGTADALWGGIITKLNASLSSSRTPIGARRAWPAPASTHPTQRAVDWSEIASELNE